MGVDSSRDEALSRIRRNIDKSGHHIYLIVGGACPRPVYTIGLLPKLGFELLLAGAADFSNNEAIEIVDVVARRLTESQTASQMPLDLQALGFFSLHDVDSSWSSELLLGALDFFDVKEVPTRQVVPDDAHWTIDVPDASKVWSAGSSRIWKHLHEPWPYSTAPESIVTTNLAALRGGNIAIVDRLSGNHWRMISGASAPLSNEVMRDVPIGILLNADPTLLRALELEVGEGIQRRAPHGPWLTMQEGNS